MMPNFETHRLLSLVDHLKVEQEETFFKDLRHRLRHFKNKINLNNKFHEVYVENFKSLSKNYMVKQRFKKTNVLKPNLAQNLNLTKNIFNTNLIISKIVTNLIL